jgi:hypothetical protein
MMKVLIPSMQEVDLDMEFPAYYRGEHHWNYAILMSEKKMLRVCLCVDMASIEETTFVDVYHETFIEKGTKITREEFEEAFQEAQKRISECYVEQLQTV